MRHLGMLFGTARKPFDLKKNLPADMPYEVNDVDDAIERICGEKPFDEFAFCERLSQLGDHNS